jgi:hypothetical protein
MLCDWTEKVSLLVDGELPRAEAASVEAHLAGCDECRAARGEFLFFRQQLGSYRADANPSAQRRALETILGQRPAAAPAPRTWGRGRLLAALGISPLNPATAAALALILTAGVGLAVYLSLRRETPRVVHAPAADNGTRTATARPEPTPEARAEVRGRDGASVSDNSPRERRTVADARASRPRKGQGGRRPAPAEAGTLNTTAAAGRPERRELPPAGLDTSRHVEQAQLLLRSFRNARADDDLSYERARSERLLYRNIVLRREAASRNDPLLASVLGRLEPILLDIANLPDRPAPADVASIRERVRRQNLVVILQAGVEKP